MQHEGVDAQLPDACGARFRLEPFSERHWRPGDHASLANRTREELRRVFTVVRSPQRRLASGYHYVHQGTSLNATQQQICSFARSTTAAHAAVGAQARMIAGDPVRLAETPYGWLHVFETAGPPEVGLAGRACARLRLFAFVGITEEWNATVCLFHAMYGGAPQQAEFVNVRPGGYFGAQHSLKQADCGDAADEQLFACAMDVFMMRVAQHPHCAELLTHRPQGGAGSRLFHRRSSGPRRACYLAND